jgi:hypothetical protein
MSASSGQHDQIGRRLPRPIARAPDARKVAVDVAYRGIELCERDGELQEWILWFRFQVPVPGSRCALDSDAVFCRKDALGNQGATTNRNWNRNTEPVRISKSLACNRIPS